MTTRHDLEVHDSDGALVATAAVIGEPQADAVVVDIHVGPGQQPSGVRAALVETVLARPEFTPGTSVTANAPAGDGEVVAALLERTDDPTARRAGASCIVEGTVPPGPPER